jgi:dihydrofolate reductase
MRVVLVFVSTLNGKITMGDDPEVRHWSSESDQEYYSGIWKDSRLIVMGSNTYRLNVITPSSSKLILVMTGRPEKYRLKEITGQLEFTDKSPSALVAWYGKTSVDRMTVVGGPLVASSFLREKLVDELWLTIEPQLFGRGLNLIADDDLRVRLQLKDVTRVNESGTLITKYSCLR